MEPDSLSFLDRLADFDVNSEVVQNLLMMVLILIGIAILVRIGTRVAHRYITETTSLYRTTRTIRHIGLFLALTLLLGLFVEDLGGFVTILTVVGAGLAIALREVLLSVAGWARLTLLTTYKYGDRIEINGIKGDVIDIRVMRTTLMEIGGWVDAEQSTGRIVHFPNAWLFAHAVYNYTRGFSFVWNEMSVTVSYRSDWEGARAILLSLAEESSAIIEKQVAQQIREMSREYLVHYSILTPFVYLRLAPNGVHLTLRHLCEARKRRGTVHALTISLLQAFEAHGGIELAYPVTSVTLPETPQFGPMPGRTQRRDPG